MNCRIADILAHRGEVLLEAHVRLTMRHDPRIGRVHRQRGIGIAGIEGIDDRLDVGLHCLRDRILVDRFRAFGAASGYKEERRRQYPDTLHHCAPSFVLQLSIASSHLPSVPRR